VFSGKAAQVPAVLQVVPDARRPQVAHVRAQWLVALQVSHLQPRLQQTHQSQEPPLPTHWQVLQGQPHLQLVFHRREEEQTKTVWQSRRRDFLKIQLFGHFLL
jgi:hypothetical protein